MKELMNTLESNWEKEEKKANAEIKKLSKKTNSKILNYKSEEIDMEENPECQRKCKLARMVFDEGIDMYEEGEMTFEEFIADLNKALKAI